MVNNMINLNYKKSRIPLSNNELNYLFEILETYAKSKNGSWMNEISYKDVSYYWSSSLNLDNGILGIRPVFKNEIYLMTNLNNTSNEMLIKSWIKLIAATTIHELFHMYQQQKYGKLLWMIMKIPEVIPCLYGKVFIEKEAIKIENEATEFINNNFKW